MDDPFWYIQLEKEMVYHFCPAHLEASRDLACKSIVTMKNVGLLPQIQAIMWEKQPSQV